MTQLIVHSNDNSIQQIVGLWTIKIILWLNKDKLTKVELEPTTSWTWRSATNWAIHPYVGGLPIFVNFFGRGSKLN